eukprot:Skav217748  [mRNA]  locus=scaffold7254:26045:32596:+ [translate_table: standard]
MLLGCLWLLGWFSSELASPVIWYILCPHVNLSQRDTVPVEMGEGWWRLTCQETAPEAEDDEVQMQAEIRVDVDEMAKRFKSLLLKSVDIPVPIEVLASAWAKGMGHAFTVTSGAVRMPGTRPGEHFDCDREQRPSSGVLAPSCHVSAAKHRKDGDGTLRLPARERVKLVRSLQCVDAAVEAIDDDESVAETLRCMATAVSIVWWMFGKPRNESIIAALTGQQTPENDKEDQLRIG